MSSALPDWVNRTSCTFSEPPGSVRVSFYCCCRGLRRCAPSLLMQCYARSGAFLFLILSLYASAPSCHQAGRLDSVLTTWVYSVEHNVVVQLPPVDLFDPRRGVQAASGQR
jgi:hypothetical protein